MIKILVLSTILACVMMYLYTNPIEMPCLCQKQKWWQICIPETEKGSDTCENIKSVTDAIHDAFRTVFNVLEEVVDVLSFRIPIIPTDWLPNLAKLITNNFPTLDIDGPLDLIPTVTFSCEIPNPIKAIVDASNKIMSIIESIIDKIKGIIESVPTPAYILDKLNGIVSEIINSFTKYLNPVNWF